MFIELWLGLIVLVPSTSKSLRITVKNIFFCFGCSWLIEIKTFDIPRPFLDAIASLDLEYESESVSLHKAFSICNHF